MRRSPRLWLALAAAAAVAGLGALLPLAGSFGGPAAVPVHAVEKASFERRVPAQGNLKAVHATPIVVPVGVPGPFRIGWIAQDGIRVKAGETVIRFDPSEIEKRLVEADDRLRESRLQMDKESTTALAELNRLQREAELARLELDNASQFQKKDAVIFSRGEIIESDIDQTLAREREEHARDARRTRERLSGTERELLGIQMREAERKIAQARAALAALAVAAPHDGVLVVARDWQGNVVRVGDNVWNGQTLAEIPDLALMEAEVFVLEADAGGLTPGKPATVSLESNPGVVYKAKIARTDAIAKPRLPGSPVQYFSVTLELERTDPKLMKPGQRVRAALLLDKRAEALLVPRQAVFERDGRMVVYRRERKAEASFVPVPVELGPSGAGRVVVEKGLKAGDVVALRDPARPAAEPPEQTPDGTAAPVAPGAVGAPAR